MNKLNIEIFNLVAIISILIVPLFKNNYKNLFVILITVVQSFLLSLVISYVFRYGKIEYTYISNDIIKDIPISIDYLSSFFAGIISLSFILGLWYSNSYTKHYSKTNSELNIHYISIVVAYTSLIDICFSNNSLIFLVFWELMALSTFLLVIFDNEKVKTLKAGIYYLIMSHIGVLFLIIGFLWLNIKTGDFCMNNQNIISNIPIEIRTIIFFILFIGFGIKAGFVPFHTWLPIAHPAAPAHISGLMSGIIIKIGIYGIFRSLLWLQPNFLVAGIVILIVSIITALYGVMLAIVQHNLKKLLAYHSIENIGIIGIGIGIGCIGLEYHNNILIIAGFVGSLLHTFNHSLFKSLLFYSSGNVYNLSKTMNIDSLGGYFKMLPQTALLFLIASIAICGLPPFNGFISEFLIYSGLLSNMQDQAFEIILLFFFTIIGLVLVGGLALLCFTKAFGIVFLGTEREKNVNNKNAGESAYSNFPLFIIAVFILFIGVFPSYILKLLNNVVSLYTNIPSTSYQDEVIRITTQIGFYSLLLIIISTVLYLLKKQFNKAKVISIDQTWGCGYTGDMSKMQYTASSYAKTYQSLAGPILKISKKKKHPKELFPIKIYYQTHAGDKI